MTVLEFLLPHNRCALLSSSPEHLLDVPPKRGDSPPALHNEWEVWKVLTPGSSYSHSDSPGPGVAWAWRLLTSDPQRGDSVRSSG